MANIRDIAELAGVSVATVSRALRRPEVVKPATIEKVEAAIRELDYTPNSLASNLRRQKSDSIVIAVPDFHNPFFSVVIQGVQSVANDHGYKVLLGETGHDQNRLDRYAEMLVRKEADGLILLGAQLPSVIARSSSATEFPAVFACEYQLDLHWPRVRIDNFRAAGDAVRHLAELGHRSIAHIAGPLDNPLTVERRAGFESALRHAKLDTLPDLTVAGDFSIQSGYAAMKRLLSQGTGFTAVFCASDEMAIGALKAIAEAGLKVPGDLSVIGFDDIKFAAFASPPLTTIAQPCFEIGERAMTMMSSLLRGEEEAIYEVVLPHRLIARDSTGPAVS